MRGPAVRQPSATLGLMTRLNPTGFDETKHPRGQPENRGRFKGKPIPAPPKATARNRRGEPGAGTQPSEPKPTLFATVMRDCGQWSVALKGRSVGLIAVGSKADAVTWAEEYLAGNGGGEMTITDRAGSMQRRCIVRAAPRKQPAKVTVRCAKRGATVVYGSDVEEDLVYGRGTSHRSRTAALERARSHLANHYGGGEIEIQNPAGTVIGQETVPAPDWWLGDETTPNGTGDDR